MSTAGGTSLARITWTVSESLPTPKERDPMRDDPSVIGLVTRARSGDKQAWDAIVERYAPLIWSICRRYQLDRADADDVAQSVWLRLVDQLDVIR